MHCARMLAAVIDRSIPCAGNLRRSRLLFETPHIRVNYRVAERYSIEVKKGDLGMDTGAGA